MIDTAALIAATTFAKPKGLARVSILPSGYTHPQEREINRVSADGNYALISVPYRRRQYSGALLTPAGEWVELPFHSYRDRKIAEAVSDFAHITAQLAQLPDPLVVELDTDESDLYRRVSELRTRLQDDKGKALSEYDVRQLSFYHQSDDATVAAAKLYMALRRQLETVLKTHAHPYAALAATHTISHTEYQNSPFTLALAAPQAIDLDAEHASAIAVVEAAKADAARAQAELTTERTELATELGKALVARVVGAERVLADAQQLAELGKDDIDAAAQVLIDSHGYTTLRPSGGRDAALIARDMERVDRELALIANDPEANTVLAELVTL